MSPLLALHDDLVRASLSRVADLDSIRSYAVRPPLGARRFSTFFCQPEVYITPTSASLLHDFAGALNQLFSSCVVVLACRSAQVEAH